MTWDDPNKAVRDWSDAAYLFGLLAEAANNALGRVNPALEMLVDDAAARAEESLRRWRRRLEEARGE